MLKQKFLLLCLSMLLLAGCAGVGLELNTVEKTKKLAPGMTREEVVAILGEPKSSEFKEGKWVLKYSLHENWRGWVPYQIVFDKNTRKLVSWHSDETAYEKQQKKWKDVLTPKGASAKGVSGGQMTANTPDARRWTERLSGMRLAYRSTYGDASGGGTTSDDYYLCSDGTFFSSLSSTDSFDGSGGFGYGNSSGRASGKWRILEADGEVNIIATYNDGSEDSSVLTEEDGKTLIDGVRYFVVENDQCQ